MLWGSEIGGCGEKKIALRFYHRNVAGVWTERGQAFGYLCIEVIGFILYGENLFDGIHYPR